MSKNYFSHVQRSPLLQLARVDVGEGLPLAHRLVQLLEGVVHHKLGLLPLEVGLHDPVPQLLVLVKSLLQMVLLQRSILSTKDLLEKLILPLIESLKIPSLVPQRLYLSLQRGSLLMKVGQLRLGYFLEISNCENPSR